MELKLTAGDRVRVAEGCIAKVGNREIVVVRKEDDFKDGNIVRLRRVELGKFYFHIDARLGYDIAIEVGNDEDDARYNKGNYFETAEKAAAAAKVVEAALKKFHEENC